MTADASIRQWGRAWAALAVALGLHVVDETLTDFLPLYNSIVATLRDAHPWVPLPTFGFSLWLTGLIVGVTILLALTPLVFAGKTYLRPLAYFLGALMTLNACGHIGASLYMGELAPGTLSSPVLLIAAIALLIATRRVRRDATRE